jgi:aspartate ammonia-lyase
MSDKHKKEMKFENERLNKEMQNLIENHGKELTFKLE